MASNFTLVDPAGWELDLHSVYSAYMGHFQLHNIAWYERSWASLFLNFDAFLQFGWPTVVVTDARTGKAHIVTRLTSVGAFVKMVKTRFGEVLPPLNNITMVQPFETSQRHLRTISDLVSFKKVSATLPAAALSARRARVRQGDIGAIQKLWHSRDSVWLSVACEVAERSGSIDAWGYSVLRAAHVEASGIWPPQPADNYRKGYYVTLEALERKILQGSPRDFVWADASILPRAKLADVVGAIVSSLSGIESESQQNPLVIVSHGETPGFSELKLKLPNNVFIVDVSMLERHMYAAGIRGSMPDPIQPARTRPPTAALPLPALMRSLEADLAPRGAPYGVAGNDALSTLLALQMLMGDAPATLPTPSRPRFRHAAHSAPTLAGLMLPPEHPGQSSMFSLPTSASSGPFRGPALQSGPPSPRRGQFYTQLAASGSTPHIGSYIAPATAGTSRAHGETTPNDNTGPVKAQASTLGRTNGRSAQSREQRASAGVDELVDGFGQLRAGGT